MRSTIRILGPQYQYFRDESTPMTHHVSKHVQRFSDAFWYLQIFHALVALGALGLTVALYGTVWNCGSDCQYFATNTFLSTSVSENNRGWPVVPDSLTASPATKLGNWATTPYYGCMQEAGLATEYCNNATTDQYITCLNANAQTKAALATCTSFTSQYYFAWPTGDQFVSCLWNSPVLSAWTNVQTSRKQRNGFLSCVKSMAFPFFETPLGTDSHVFLGSYNWGVLGVVGLAGMTSFAVFTASPFVEGTVIEGMVGYYEKLGVLWSIIAFTWNFGLFVITLALMLSVQVVFSTTSFALVWAITGVLCAYFALEIADNWGQWNHGERPDNLNPFDHRKKAREDYERFQAAKTIKEKEEAAERMRQQEERDRQERGAEAHLALLPEQTHATYHIASWNPGLYASPCLSIWADGYLFTDFALWLAFAGATTQVTTDYVWNVFTIIILYRINNSNMARLLYECFHSDRDDKGHQVHSYDTFKQKHSGFDTDRDNVHLDLKVVSLSLQIANIILFIALLTVVFEPSQNTTAASNAFVVFIWLGFIVPEAIRLGVHLFCQMTYGHNHGMVLLLWHQFIWNWDVIVRVAVMCAITWSANNDSAPYGTFGFIKAKSDFLLNRGLTYLAPF